MCLCTNLALEATRRNVWTQFKNTPFTAKPPLTLKFVMHTYGFWYINVHYKCEFCEKKLKLDFALAHCAKKLFYVDF